MRSSHSILIAIQLLVAFSADIVQSEQDTKAGYRFLLQPKRNDRRCTVVHWGDGFVIAGFVGSVRAIRRPM